LEFLDLIDDLVYITVYGDLPDWKVENCMGEDLLTQIS